MGRGSGFRPFSFRGGGTWQGEGKSNGKYVERFAMYYACVTALHSGRTPEGSTNPEERFADVPRDGRCKEVRFSAKEAIW